MAPPPWVPGLWLELASLRAGDYVEMLDRDMVRRRFRVHLRMWSGAKGVTSVLLRSPDTGDDLLANRLGWVTGD